MAELLLENVALLPAMAATLFITTIWLAVPPLGHLYK